jgi:hypothetical protein
MFRALFIALCLAIGMMFFYSVDELPADLRRLRRISRQLAERAYSALKDSGFKKQRLSVYYSWKGISKRSLP